MTQEKLYRYLRGESTAAERQRILKWINASSENMQTYRALRSVYDAVLCGEPELHLSHDAVSGGNRRAAFRAHVPAVAAAVVCAVVMAGAWFLVPRTEMRPQSMVNDIYSPVGQRTELTLADGTRVWLNSNSRIIMPADGKMRSVTLEGEAFFSVSKSDTEPFVVNTAGRSVTVHGTQFNVNAYPESRRMEVQLYEGSVSVTDTLAVRTVTLVPGEQLMAGTGGLTVSNFVIEDNAPSWTQGVFTFRNCTYAEVLTAMCCVYNVELTLAGSWPETQRCTCKFHDADGLLNMLESLNDIRPFKYQWNPDTRQLRVE